MTRLDVFPDQKREEGDPRFFWGDYYYGDEEKNMGVFEGDGRLVDI